jgi:hypothetical protein
MATRALTAMARRKSSVGKPIRQVEGPRRNWRQLLNSQDANAIWQKIFTLVQSSAYHRADPAQQTQDIFIELLVKGRLRLYRKEHWLDSAIDSEILRMLRL